MKNNNLLRSRLSSLVMAGLAAGLSAPVAASVADTAMPAANGCKALADCKGMKPAQVDTASCAGNGKCGAVAKPEAVKMDSARAKILGAKSDKEFKKACKAAGRKVEAASCMGQNSCKGIYMVKGRTMDVACKGQAKCTGLKCEI